MAKNQKNQGFAAIRDVVSSSRFRESRLQNFLNKIMTDLQFLSQNMSATSDVNSIIANVPSGTVRRAMAFIGALPVIIVFPFFQKYFTKGITVGAVKE